METSSSLNGAIILSEEDADKILKKIGWLCVIDSVRETFREEALGNTISPPKVIMHIDEFHNDYRVMPSYMKKYPEYCGCKIVCACPENPKNRLPFVMGHYMLNDARTQRLLMLSGARSITAWRTAAATAVAVQALNFTGKKQTLGILGCGLQAYYHIPAICAIANIGRILVSDINPTNMAALRKYFTCSDMPTIEESNKNRIFFSSDIVVTLTPTTEPHVFETDLPPRKMVIATVGGDSNRKIEIDPWVLPLVDPFCDSHEQAAHTGLMERALSNNIISMSDLKSIGDLLIGKVSPGDKAIKLFISTGVALEDLITAKLVYENRSLLV